MTRRTKWLAGIGALLLVLVAGVAIALAVFVPSNEELAAKAEAKLEEALGVKVTIGSLRWIILPMPAVVLQDVATVQPRPLSAKRIAAYVHLKPLFDKVVSIESVDVDGAVVPQLSLREFSGNEKQGKGAQESRDSKSGKAAADDKGGGLAGQFRMAPIPLQHLHFTDLTWVSRRGIPVVYEGDIDFDESWRPRKAHVRRPGVTPETGLILTRREKEDRWQAQITIGGGTANGEVRIKESPNGTLRLAGELLPKNIEVSTAVVAFNRKAVVAGRGNGSTVLEAEGDNIAGLARTLHTKTQFTLAPASVLRFDLHKAIKTLGKEHDGETQLESLTGLMESQNTAQGTIWTYSGLKAKSGALTGSGNIVLFNRQIEAKGAVDLVDGLVGVPIEVTGSLDKPHVTVPKGSIAGAVIGTAILPVIGTVIGARIGALFNSGPKGPEDAPAGAAPQAKAAAKPTPGTKPRPATPRAP